MSGSQAAKYRVNGEELNDDFFNLRFLDIDLRLVELSNKLGQFDSATDQLIARGLLQIQNQLQAALAGVQGELTTFETAIASLEANLTTLEQNVTEIVGGASFPAEFTTIDPIAGIVGENVQAALVELVATNDVQSNQIVELQDDVSTLQSQINGIGDVITVADLTAAGALTGLDKGDVIHVENNGSSKWVRYQITAAGDGTWSGATKVVIFTQDQAPASHGHVTGDITGLDAALAARVQTSRNVATSGLATGGGNLSTDRTINVPKASASQIRVATDDASAMTPKGVADAMAETPLTDAATIAWDMSTGFDFGVTLAGNRTLANPTSVTVGKSGHIRVVQDATGSRTLSFGSNYKFSSGTAPTLTTDAGREDYLFYKAVSATKILISLGKDFR